MSMSNSTEIAVLDIFLTGTVPAYIAADTRHLALFTADPTDTGSLANEANYTGYARIPIAKSGTWIGGANPFVNANLIQFGVCTAGTNAITHFAIVDTGPATGTPVTMMISGALSGTLNVSSGIQPQFGPGVLQINAE